MSFSDQQLERLRGAFVDSESPATDNCPTPETIWGASHGSLGEQQTLAIVEHVAGCAHCALAWRIGIELVPFDPKAQGQGADEPGFFERVSKWLAELLPAGDGLRKPAMISGLALLVLLVGLSFMVDFMRPVRPQLPPSTLRNPLTIEITADTTTEGSLPRDEFVLSWSGAPEGSTYNLTVTTAELAVISRAIDLEQARFVVPPGDLADQPEGAEVLWQVETMLADGRRARSNTFVTRITERR